jgi:hypothetical protein
MRAFYPVLAAMELTAEFGYTTAKSSTDEYTTSCQSFHNYSILKYIKMII